jgi:hypothetical protein
MNIIKDLLFGLFLVPLWKAMKSSLEVILMLLTIILLGFLIRREYSRKAEGFAATSTGTMIQLRNSHIPTEEDEVYAREELPKIIDRGLKQMTGSGLELSGDGKYLLNDSSKITGLLSELRRNVSSKNL